MHRLDRASLPLAGPLAAQLLTRMLALGWIVRGENRAITMTPAGRHGLRAVFGIDREMTAAA